MVADEEVPPVDVLELLDLGLVEGVEGGDEMFEEVLHVGAEFPLIGGEVFVVVEEGGF